MERDVMMKSAQQVGEVVQGMAEGSRKRMGRGSMPPLTRHGPSSRTGWSGQRAT